jgi:amidase
MRKISTLSRRQMLGALGLGAIAMHNSAAAGAAPGFELEEVTAAELQKAMASGQHSAEQIAQLYLGRIEHIDRSGPHLNSVVERNPYAHAIARNLGTSH